MCCTAKMLLVALTNAPTADAASSVMTDPLCLCLGPDTKLVAQVMSALLGVLRGADEALQEFLIQQVTALVALLKAHMRKWLTDILDVIGSFWSVTSPLLPHLLRLLSELAGASFPCAVTVLLL